MEVKLIVAGGKSAGRIVPIVGPRFFIGRADDCQLRPTSDLVSRHHCVILVDEGGVSVRDFESKNGTFVNGERIKGQKELKSGDRLQVGALVFEVQFTVAMGGKQRPKVHTVEEAAARTAAVPTADDVDLSDWLGGDEPTGTAVAADTRPVNASPSETVAEKPAEKPQPEKMESPKKKVKKTEPAHGKPGARPMGLKKPKAVDSQSAAADMLRQLFGRK